MHKGFCAYGNLLTHHHTVAAQLQLSAQTAELSTEVVAAMPIAMRLLILLCALASTTIEASHLSGVSSARARDHEQLASCHEDRRNGAIFLNKRLHKSNLSRSTDDASMTTAKHNNKRNFTAPERLLPTEKYGSHARHAAERELSGPDPRWWRSSAWWVRGGSTPRKMTDQDLFAREQQAVRNVLLYYPNLIGALPFVSAGAH